MLQPRADSPHNAIQGFAQENGFALIKILQDVCSRIHASRRTANAHPEPRKILGTQTLRDALEALLAARSTFLPDAQSSGGDVQVVADDQQIIQGNFVE